MDVVQAEEVRWLWRPYIPLGKITIIQGDPGEGKTTFALALVAALTAGNALPETPDALPPINVIYQTAEDGLADTIKPRLLSLGADCSRVMVIDETIHELTMRYKRLEQAIKKTDAKLLILDPIQAYLGGNVDMHRANEVRPVIKQISLMAERTSCAVIMIGHINKAQGMKSSYRGLGSIDFRAAARSVLVVGRSKDDPAIRIAAHDKSSLVPEGRAIMFELSEGQGFVWRGTCDASVDDVLSGSYGGAQSKTVQMELLLREWLSGGPVASDEIITRAKEVGVSERTLKIAKQRLEVKSVKIGEKWFAALPG
jgi:RecA-family ATPase